MEMNLQPRAPACAVTGAPFREGDRVASLLVRTDSGGVARLDALEAHSASLRPEGFVACRWVQAYKPQPREENPERTLKLNAENLFLTLADPSTEATPETARLVRLLALLLERKRLLRPRGRSAESGRELYEHARTKQIFEIEAIDVTEDFFIAVREQLSVLVGEPRAAQAGPAAQPAVPAPG